ncbi:MAG: hypothetical protein N3B10_00150 [Armatimonadetes bacterium]|nr:hypothetical protein [Armatimonadota bacterium]MCX7966880.1 hypothetical protein [Armatimonadota bacterium]MDW8141838.1 hypothetical protein [Armatimonadota bacterium]
MMRRKWTFALIFVAIGNLWGQESVFVNLEQLASLHPAWELADSISRKPKPTISFCPMPYLSLTDLSLSSPSLRISQLADWFEEQKLRWASELESLQKRQQQILAWQMHLLLPPLPIADPVARWKFMVHQSEKQATERFRLTLRLSFPDMLSPEEKAALERRKRELDAEIEPPPVVPQPIFIPVFTAEKFDLTPPSPLTDPEKVLELVTPPFSSPQQTSKIQIPDTSDLSPRLLTESAVATLRSIAFEAARNFAAAYAMQKGWKASSLRQPKLLDATEVKRAWLHWLKSVQPKE